MVLTLRFKSYTLGFKSLTLLLARAVQGNGPFTITPSNHLAGMISLETWSTSVAIEKSILINSCYQL